VSAKVLPGQRIICAKSIFRNYPSLTSIVFVWEKEIPVILLDEISAYIDRTLYHLSYNLGLYLEGRQLNRRGHFNIPRRNFVRRREQEEII